MSDNEFLQITPKDTNKSQVNSFNSPLSFPKKEHNSQVSSQFKEDERKRSSINFDEKHKQSEESNEKPMEGSKFAQKENYRMAGYFKKLQLKISDANSQQISEEICQDIEEQIQNLILDNKLDISSNRIDVDSLISEVPINPGEIFEKNIKETKLKEQRKVKEHLEDKLRFLSQDISLIEHEIDTTFDQKRGKFGVQILKELTEEEKKEKQEQIRAIAKERKELEKKRLARLEEMEKKVEMKIEEANEKEKELKSKKDQEKSEELKKKLEEQKKYQLARDEQFKIEREKLKKVLMSKPLFEKLREKSQEEEKLSLEERKKTLAVIRELHQPLNASEIKEHAKKVGEELKTMREKSNAAASASLFKYQKPFISDVYKKISKEKKNTVQELIEEHKRHKLVQEKIKEFEENTLKNTEVKIDPLKQSQMKSIIEQIEHKPDYHWFREKKRPKMILIGIHDPKESGIEKDLTSNKDDTTTLQKDITKHKKNLSSKTNLLPENDQLSRKLGKDYLISLRQGRAKSQSGKSYSSNITAGDQQNQNVEPSKNKKRNLIKNESERALSSQNTSLPTIKQNNSIQFPSKIDYLKELKAQHTLVRSTTPDWQRYLKKNQQLKTADKAQYILQQSERLESMAQRKEKLQKVRNGSKSNHTNIEGINNNEVVDSYIESIKAKFAFIEQAESLMQ